MTISEIDRGFLVLCEEVRRDSFDPHRTVGAVIVSQDGSAIGTGANKPPIELNFTREEIYDMVEREPESKYFIIEHAERNAISDARKSRQSLKGATMYCSLFPCADCARAIVSAGISRLVVPQQALDPVRDLKWAEHYRYARNIFDRAQVKVDSLSQAELPESALSSRR